MGRVLRTRNPRRIPGWARSHHATARTETGISDAVRTALPRARLTLETADDLIAYPILSVAEAQRRHGRSNQANRDAINALVDIGLLEPYGSQTYDRLSWSRRVFQAIDG